MKTKKRGIRTYKCDKCGKTPAIQIIHYQRRQALINGEICLCDKNNICSWGFFNKYFKDDKRVQKILEKERNKK